VNNYFDPTWTSRCHCYWCPAPCSSKLTGRLHSCELPVRSRLQLCCISSTAFCAQEWEAQESLGFLGLSCRTMSTRAGLTAPDACIRQHALDEELVTNSLPWKVTSADCRWDTESLTGILIHTVGVPLPAPHLDWYHPQSPRSHRRNVVVMSRLICWC
jgi:hypothetical protein